MINKILTATGLPYRETRFTKPPANKTYIVYMDDVETDGPDYMPTVLLHGVTLEVYEPKPDPQAEASIEAAIAAAGLQYRKQARYWLQEEQRYQVIYEFDYTEKRRT